ncbi:MAG: hypothetical protein ABSA21_02825 [Candidatus Limnocylindrales bacterium]|jgi:hypothetical protein
MPDLYTWIALAAAALAFVLGVQVFGVAGALAALIAAVCLLALVGVASGQRARRHLARRQARFQPTDEVFRDPSSGALTRVHVDPATGERRYWEDS